MSSEKQLEYFYRCDEGRLRVVLRFLSGLTELSNITLEVCLENLPKKNFMGNR